MITLNQANSYFKHGKPILLDIQGFIKEPVDCNHVKTNSRNYFIGFKIATQRANKGLLLFDYTNTNVIYKDTNVSIKAIN